DLTCAGCGAVTRAHVKWSHSPAGDACEPAFGLPLLLHTPCAGEVLWAYNSRHLDFLAGYVQASIRDRTANHNGSLASRLPRWLKAAGNRQAVLHSISHLRAMLPDLTKD
ncbi:MAG: hypothetical protein WCC60_20190, partial [Ilumatobacteraceae bacterium]